MNSVTEVAPVITADNNALKRDFPLKPFAIRHKLAGHPLLTLRKLAREPARRMVRLIRSSQSHRPEKSA